MFELNVFRLIQNSMRKCGPYGIAHKLVVVIVLVFAEQPQRTAAAILLVVLKCECVIDC